MSLRKPAIAGVRTTRREVAPEAPFQAAQHLSDLIGGIYDCALDPAKWDGVLADINREFDFCSSVLGLVPLRSGVQSLSVQVGIDAEWLEVAPSYTVEALDLWGGAERVGQYPLDEPVIYAQLDVYAERHSNRYFRDVLEPRRMVDAALVHLARDEALVGYVAFNRDEPAGLLGKADVNAIRMLGPHFRRAVTISNIFDMQAIEVGTFGAVLDSFAFGVILLDGQMAIIHANQAGADLLAARDPFRSVRGVLGLVTPAANDAVQRAVIDAAGDRMSLGSKGIGIPLRSAGGLTFVVHVLPLQGGEMRRSVGQRASVALFVVPAETPRSMPTDALALLYDLTPAEARTLDLLVAGKTRSQIGATLGIAPSTVKSHIVHLFDKTGCRRQVDLVRLAANVSLPMAAGLAAPL